MNSIGSADFILSCFNRDYNKQNSILKSEKPIYNQVNFDDSINKYINKSSSYNPGTVIKDEIESIGKQNVVSHKETSDEVDKLQQSESFKTNNGIGITDSKSDDPSIVIKFSVKNIIIVVLIVVLIYCFYLITKYKSKLEKYKYKLHKHKI